MNYTQYYDGYIPEGLDIQGAVNRFNSGERCWCRDTLTACDDLSCEHCLLCCNATLPDLLDIGQKIVLFAHWAREHGYTVDRAGLDELEERYSWMFNGGSRPWQPYDYEGRLPPEDDFDESTVVDDFNSGMECWCDNGHVGSCPDGGCSNCLLCCNFTKPGESPGVKILLFSKWAKDHGYYIDRDGLADLEYANDNPFNTKVERIGY